MTRPLLVFVVLATAAATGACASSGAVPRPFPVPGGATTSQAAPAPVANAAPAPAPTPAPAPAPMPVPEPQPKALVDTYALTGTALALRGKPYRNGGADPDGFDCSGFIQYVFGRHGISVPRDVKSQFAVGHVVRPDEIAPGDILFFTTVAPGASHVGIALGGGTFVHAPSSKGVVRVERLSVPYWSQRFVGARRLT